MLANLVLVSSQVSRRKRRSDSQVAMRYVGYGKTWATVQYDNRNS